MGAILAMIPWPLVLELGLKAINWFVKKKEERDRLRKDFIKFIKKHDNDVLESLEIRDEYKKIISEINKEEEGSNGIDSGR